MPVYDALAATKTEHWQLGAIYEDEGTIMGTYRVHDNIFLEQLGLKTPDHPDSRLKDDFTTRLWLAHGDQLTSHHIRAVKAEQHRASRTYDRREWLLGIPAWFHVQMSLVSMLVRTHSKSDLDTQQAHHCFSTDVAHWNRSFTSKDNLKYNQMDKLVTQSYRARIAAFFFAAMQGASVPVESTNGQLLDPDAVSEAIQALSP
jgi:hypothetical protein